MGYRIDGEMMRRKIGQAGGIRPFCQRTGINRQVIYNLLSGASPDYRTICRIIEGLSLEDEEIIGIFFSRREDSLLLGLGQGAASDGF